MVAPGRLDAEVAADAGGPGSAESFDLREFGEGVEFPVEAVEPAGGFGVLGEPGVAFPAGGVEFVALFVEVADGPVEAG